MKMKVLRVTGTKNTTKRITLIYMGGRVGAGHDSDLNLQKVRKVLELGCGGGQNAIKYAELGFEVHGVDSSEELLKTAREIDIPETKLEFSNVNLDKKMPFQDESFDAVVVVGTLQYLMEPSACVQDVFRILKPGGFFIVCQRNALSFNVLRRPLSFL